MKLSSRSIRPFKLHKSYLPHAEGSCLVSMGQTQVLCVATIEEKAPDHAQEKGTGWVHAEYAMLPRSGEKRTPRGKASGGGRAQEISRLVGRALRASVNLADLAPYLITVDCDVLRADGGTRTAAVNGALVALVQALHKLWKEKKISKWPLKRFIGAVSVGIVKGKPLVDMSYADDSNAETDLNLVLTDRGEIVEIQGTAEGVPFTESQMKSMIQLAKRGIAGIIEAQKRTLGPLSKIASSR